MEDDSSQEQLMAAAPSVQGVIPPYLYFLIEHTALQIAGIWMFLSFPVLALGQIFPALPVMRLIFFARYRYNFHCRNNEDC